MAALTLLALALLAGSACSSPAPRIVGGSVADVKELPSVVQVEFRGTSTNIWSQSCGGNILTSRYVVTAAQCFHGIFYDPRNRRIRAGTSELETGGQVSNVEVEFNHPTYGRNDMDGDISVVRLRDPLVYNDVIQQGPIILQSFYLPSGLSVNLAGWGATVLGGLPSKELQEITVQIVNPSTCSEEYSHLPIPRVITENMICARNTEGNDFCQGDIGGPMYYDKILVGVMSFSYDCGNASLPGVSTAVSSYTDWIIEQAI